jgi:hypothetical protein
MQHMVAFVNLHDQRLALVEAGREHGRSELEYKQVREYIAQAPELKGFAVVLAVPPDGEWEAGFQTTPDVQLALRKIG